jgi:hypothetical protein
MLTPIVDTQVMPDPPTPTRLLLHAYPTRLLSHAYSYTPTLTRLLLHAYSYTPTLTRLLTPIVDTQVMPDPLAPGLHLLAAKDLAEQVARIY